MVTPIFLLIILINFTVFCATFANAFYDSLIVPNITCTWNSLPETLVNAPSYNPFKCDLYHYYYEYTLY